MKYTREDVIMWPDDERLKNAIGKECFYADSRCIVIGVANGKYGLSYSPLEDSIGQGILKKVDNDELTDIPFLVDGCNRAYIILKKEPVKKYIPFDFSLKEDRDALIGKRILSKEENYDSLIVGFLRYTDGDWRADSTNLSHKPIELLTSYVFADTGKPVGKEVEE